MEDDYEGLTEADVLDTIEYVVQGERQTASRSHSSASGVPQSASEEDEFQSPESSTKDTASEAETISSSRANPYKNRQKLELEYLKAKVRELEKELRRLEQENDEKLVGVGDSVWRRVAQQQSIERQKALSENAKLKHQLEEQIKFSKSLKKVIRKRPNLTVRVSFPLESAQSQSELTLLFWFRDCLFVQAFGGSSYTGQPRKRKSLPENLPEELLQSAEEYYRHLDTTIRDMQADQITKDHRSIDVRVLKSPSGHNAIRIDMIEARRFPFPFHSVAREFWNFLSVGSNHEQVIEDIVRKVEHTNDTLLATTDMQFPVGDHFGLLNATAGFRKYVQEDRVVITYVSHGECGAKKNPKDKFTVIEKGWMMAKAIPGSPDASILLGGSQFSPTLVEPDKNGLETLHLSPSADAKLGFDEKPFEVGILTEVIFNAYQKTASYIYAVIENTLMEEHLQQKERP